MDKRKNFAKLFYWLFFFWLVSIVVISSLPKLSDPDIEWLSDFQIRLDYLFHFGAFALLALFWCISYFLKNVDYSLKKRVRFFLLLMVFAALDEAHQIFIPGRSFNPIDLLFNELGLSVSIFGWPIIEKYFKKWWC